jgi:hypothetical protein
LKVQQKGRVMVEPVECVENPTKRKAKPCRVVFKAGIFCS